MAKDDNENHSTMVEEISEDTKPPKPRMTWSSKFEFMVSLIGYSAGMSDFWRFPYLVWRNGGGAFLLAYVTILTVCGIPLYFLEVFIGQYSGKGVFEVWNFFPILKGIGISIALLNLYYASYVATFRYWLLEYMRQSFTSELPWTSCGHTWNTNSCRIAHIPDPTDNLNSTTGVSAEEEFWQHNVLSLSDGIQEVGYWRWSLILWAIIFRLFVILCLLKSVQTVGKFMLFTTFIPPLIGTAMLIQAFTQTGAKDGIRFLFTPDFSKLTDSKVWIEASFMAFYSLGPGWGAVMMMASHQKFHTDCLSFVLIGAVMDVFMSVFSSVVLFAILGVMANGIGLPVVDVVESGMSISLVGFSRALTYLPAPYIWAVVFFFGVIVLGFDGLVVCTETVVSFLEGFGDRLGRHSHLKLVLLVNGIMLLFSLPFCTQAGPYMFQLIDWYVPTWSVVVIALLEIIAIMWLYGGDRVDYGLKDMTGRKMPHIFRMAGAYVSPVLLLLLLLTSFVTYRPPKYGSYEYPEYIRAIGWVLSCSVVIPIPLYIIWQFMKLTGTPKERLKILTRPSIHWSPSDSANRLEHLERSHAERSWADIAYYNLIGRQRHPNKMNQEIVALF